MQQNILEQYISPLIKSIILSDIDGVVILKHDTTDIIEEKPLSATFHLSSSHLSKLFTLKTRAFIFAYYPDHVIAQCDCGTGLVLTILGDLSVKEGLLLRIAEELEPCIKKIAEAIQKGK